MYWSGPGMKQSSHMKIGFSTGSIALGNVRRGLDVATHKRTNAIELAALREEEFDPLLESLGGGGVLTC